MIFKMDFFISETNREKKSLIYDGCTFRVDKSFKEFRNFLEMHKKQLQVQNKNRRRVQSYIERPK